MMTIFLIKITKFQNFLNFKFQDSLRINFPVILKFQIFCILQIFGIFLQIKTTKYNCLFEFSKLSKSGF